MRGIFVDYVEVGNRIAKKRKDLGLTQEELAAETGLEQNTIAKIEKFGVGLSMESLLAICKVLKVDPNYVLCGTEKNFDAVKIVADKLHILDNQEHLEIVSGLIDIMANIDKS